MRFSPINENYLKNHINADDKETCIKDLTETIELLEKEMYNELNTGYLSVINKCSRLELLTNDIKNIQLANTDYISVTNELILRSSDVSDDHTVMENCLDRLDQINHEVKLIKKFVCKKHEFPNVKFGNTQVKVRYFDIVQNLKEMESMLTYFKKYNFYMQLNQVYKDFYSQFVLNMKDTLINWLHNLDYIEIGSTVKILDYKYKIFDDLYVYRNKIITKDFLKVYYAAEELNLKPLITQTINSKRSEMGFLGVKNKTKTRKVKSTISSLLSKKSTENSDKNNVSINQHPKNLLEKRSNNDSIDQLDEDFIKLNQPGTQKLPANSAIYEIFYSLITNVLLSFYLLQFYPSSQSFYDEIFDQIDQIKYDDYLVMKETVLPLKRLVTVLNIDSEKIDSIMEKIAFRFFESHKKSEKGIKYLIKFIDNSINFLKDLNQFNNELDELLAQKVDRTLCDYFKEKTFENPNALLGVKTEIIGILNHLKVKQTFFETKNYEIENLIYITEEEFIDQKVNEILKNKQIEAVVKSLINLKGFMDKKCRLKVIRKLESIIGGIYEGDDLILFKDTILRNYGEVSGL
ncbi:hypothetical protein NUSPORA_01808 [Nucleospora cyclopteri]